MTPSGLVICAVAMLAALSASMGLAWYVQQRSGSSRHVDATWTFSTGLVAAIAALLSAGTTPPGARQLLVAGLVGLWTLRLGVHMGQRALTTIDDPRYRKLAQDWGADATRRMFLFLQSQALVGLLLGLACVISAHAAGPFPRWQDVAGAIVMLVALGGEALADHQLKIFRQEPDAHQRICERGLWSMSRHPNYFFQWLGWCAFPLVALDLTGAYPAGWLSLAAPVVMYVVLVHLSGIPPLEAHMLRTRDAMFRDYMARTPAFFPFRLFARSHVYPASR